MIFKTRIKTNVNRILAFESSCTIAASMFPFIKIPATFARTRASQLLQSCIHFFDMIIMIMMIIIIMIIIIIIIIIIVIVIIIIITTTTTIIITSKM